MCGFSLKSHIFESCHLDIHRRRRYVWTTYLRLFFVASLFPIMAAKFLKKQRFSVKCQQKFTMFTKETKDSKYHLDPYRSVNFKTDENGNMICPAGKRFFYLKSSHVKGNKYSRTQEYYQCENCEGCELKGNCHRSKGNRITYMFRSKNYYWNITDNML